MEEDLIELGKKISKYCVGMEGNVSVRVGNSFLIKSSGHKLSNLTNNSFTFISKLGCQLDNRKPPSIEKDFHILLYNTYPSIKFIAHSHPINTLRILCGSTSLDFANSRFFPEQVVFNGAKSILVNYALPGLKLAKEIEKNLTTETPKLILLKNHGIIACDSSIEECCIITDICEKAAEVYNTSVPGYNLKRLSEDEINEILNDTNEQYRKSLV